MRILCLALLAGCGPAPKMTGTALMKFSVAPSVKSSSDLKSPLLAKVRGGVFLVEDVTLTGPRKEAPVFGDVTIEKVDLRTTDVSVEQLVTQELAPGLYTVLAMMDLNANANVEKPQPDSGDVVTLPFSNKFQIVAGEQTRRLVVFDLIYN